MAMHFNRYYCGKCHLTYLIKKDFDLHVPGCRARRKGTIHEISQPSDL